MRLSKLLKAISPSRLFLKDFSLDKRRVKEDLGKDYPSFLKIKDFFKDRQVSKHRLSFYSPGAASDMLSLLAMYDAVVSRENRHVTFVIVDIRDYYDGVIFNLFKYCRGFRLKESHKDSKHIADISFKDRSFRIIYHVNDITKFFPPELVKSIDIYYERAFEMFRSNDDVAMSRIFINMRQGGLMMTDHSFKFSSYKHLFRQVKGLPKEFGLYNNFQVWQRVYGKV